MRILNIANSRGVGKHPSTINEDFSSVASNVGYYNPQGVLEPLAPNADGTSNPVKSAVFQLADYYNEDVTIFDLSYGGWTIDDFLAIESKLWESDSEASVIFDNKKIDAVWITLGDNSSSQSISLNLFATKLLSLIERLKTLSFIDKDTRFYCMTSMRHHLGSASKAASIAMASLVNPEINIVSSFGQIGAMGNNGIFDWVHENGESAVALGKKLAQHTYLKITSPQPHNGTIYLDDNSVIDLNEGHFWGTLQHYFNWQPMLRLAPSAQLKVILPPGIISEKTFYNDHDDHDRINYTAPDGQTTVLTYYDQYRPTVTDRTVAIINGNFANSVEVLPVDASNTAPTTVTPNYTTLGFG